MDLVDTATLPLLPATEEAWMSIEALQRIAARLRFVLNVNGLGWAAASER